MKSIIHLVYLMFGAFTLAGLALAPTTEAVTPPPDGAYPSFNTAEGQNALFSLTNGIWNTALGAFTELSDGIGRFNTAVGVNALRNNNGSDSNTAVGANALFSFNGSEGLNNSAFGTNALFNLTIGMYNTALGYGAGSGISTGFYNIDIGNAGVGADHQTIRIGDGNYLSTYIAGIRGTTPFNNDAIPVLIDSAGQLGTASSSRRFKQDIEPIGRTSECVLALKPVSFHYNVHKDSIPQFGLIAEEVANVNPNLVVYDTDGKPYTVRYDAVNAMLLNEFLKEHRKVEQLTSDFNAAVAQQQKQIADLMAQLKEQAVQIQKVSAHFDIIQAARRVVANGPQRRAQARFEQ
jgi:Chaperone of endosialidase